MISISRSRHTQFSVLAQAGAVALTCMLAPVAVQAAQADEHIAIVLRDFSNPYWQALRDGAIAEGKKIGVPVTVQAGANETDTVGQNTTISTMANQPFTCFGVVPVNGTNVITPLLPISRRGTPIINLDTALNAKAVKQSGLKLTGFIGSDNKQAGRIAAKYMLKQLDGKGQVAILEGIPGEQNGINRETAFRKTVKGKLKIVQATPADYQRSKALNKTDAMLRAHPDLNGIFAANDLMGLGAARSVLNAGKKKQVTVVSIDGVTEALKAVKQGTLAASISQYPYAEGQMAVQACHKLYSGGTIPKQITSPIKLITQDNAAQAIKSFPRPFFEFKDPFGAP